MEGVVVFAQVHRMAGEHAAESLCWRGDDLVDWVQGGDAWTADGRFVPARRSWGYSRLNGAVADPTGRWAVVHERTGTAGLLLRDGKIVREIHRSPYHADEFLYPVALFPGPGGRTLLAHCPESYARIELDDAETGERLTWSTSRRVADFFHSRLSASPSAERLLSAGWVWHPWDVAVWFDVGAALDDPVTLDSLDAAPPFSRHVGLSEQGSAAWLDDDHVLLGGTAEEEDPEEAAEIAREHPGPRLHPRGIAVFDVSRRRYTEAFALGYPPGAMMPVGSRHVVTFFEHPRLVSLDAGQVVHAWTELDSGTSVSSIVGDRPCPVLALDPARGRFAVGSADGITVVTLDPAKLPR